MLYEVITQLGQGAGDEALAAEARVDRHQQDDIQLVHQVVKVVQRRGRVEHQAGLAAQIADQLQTAVDVLGSFGVEGDDGS